MVPAERDRRVLRRALCVALRTRSAPAFVAAAAEDGIVLERQSLPWLSERGHLVLPNVAAEARVLLERIYIALGADLDLLVTARSNRLPGDFVHPETER